LAKLRHFLANPEALKAMGSNGRIAMSDRNQIAVRQAELIREVLEGVEHRERSQETGVRR
jgi:hypothetical protein